MREQFTYDALPGRVVFGAGTAHTALADEVARLDATRVLLWDVASRTQIGDPLRPRTSSVSSIAFSPDGRTLAIGGSWGTLDLIRDVLWSDVTELRERVCRLIGDSPSPRDWSRYGPGIPYRESCR